MVQKQSSRNCIYSFELWSFPKLAIFSRKLVMLSSSNSKPTAPRQPLDLEGKQAIQSYFFLLCFEDILCIIKLRVCCNSVLSKSVGANFSNICSLCVSVSDFNNSYSILNFFIVIVFVIWSVICDFLWYYCQRLWFTEASGG